MAGRRRLMFAKDFTVDYFKFTALESGTFTLTIGSSVPVTNLEYVEYSVDDGVTWVKTNNVASTTVTITTPAINTGDSVLWRGSGVRCAATAATATASNYSSFTSTGQCNVSGDVNTLLGLNEPNNVIAASYIYRGLFYGMTTLVDASGLLLPATLANYCYDHIFSGCSSLTAIPTLPATTLKNYCYSYMFYGCTSLVTAPNLLAETLATYCYQYMFDGCTSLQTAPQLPATTLANYCYYRMFDGCTSLTTAPALPATTLADYCYRDMFYGCSSLTSAPALPAESLTIYCYQNMFYNCSSLTTAPALPATTLATYCYQNMFYGCSSLTTAPALPATTLANYCYYNMFVGCKFTTAPTLPALTLVSYCYRYLFYACSNLNYIKALYTTTATSSTSSWVADVQSTGIFVKNINATWTTTGSSGVPENWTIIYYDPSDEKYYTDQQKTQECDDHGNPI